ncbi:hypothetical protein DIC66_21245 [Rhodoferax lacus]|uniref:HEAT repeat domain-containing protein n=1 Tax=Rhodoferax lacus TaxID=2184758 RepID=A0A3E1R699_9BURK|nr:hypothetical protein [Rhodoferax lacus]RFO94864.1 hypothetical protein DIC66_21245 [Rhodoferax lacus]
MKSAGSIAVLACVLDSAVLLSGLAASDWTTVLGCTFLHGTACMFFAQGIAGELISGPEARRQDAAVVGFVLACVLPVLGMVGMLLLVVPALGRRAETAAALPWRQLPTPELPAKAPLHGAAHGLFGSRNLDAILHNASRPTARVAALLGTLRLPDVQAAVLLRKALKDKNEEVRLLAYALLNRKEKAVEARIHGLRQALEIATPGQACTHHRALAHAYWELYLLSAQHVASGAQVLSYVCEHARDALEHRAEDGGLQFLLGRALLRQKQWGMARQAFQDAESAGMEPRRTLAYRAEIDFRHAKAHAPCSPHRPEAAKAQLDPGYGVVEGLDHETARA